MHGVTGFKARHDFLGIAIDDRDFASITQRNREEVVDVAVMLRFGRTVFRRNQDFPACFHIGHAEFRWRGRFLLQKTRHDVDLGFGHVTRGTPVGHAGRRAVGDQGFQVICTLFPGNVRRQRLARGAFAQHTMASRASLEVTLRCRCKLGFGENRAFDIRDLSGALW